MEDYRFKYKEIIHRIKTVRSKEDKLLLVSGLLRTVAALSILILFISLIELIANGNMTFRTVLIILMMVIAIIAGSFFLFPSLTRILKFREPSLENIALRIGGVYPEIKDRLCNVIQLITNISKPQGTSEILAIAAFGDVSENVRQKDFDVIINKDEIKRSLYFFLIAFMFAVLSLGIFHSSLGAAFYRVMNYNKSFLPPANFSLSISPKKAVLLRGSNTAIYVKAKGVPPEKVILYIKEEQQENYDSYTLRADSGGTYKYEIPSIRQSVVFYAEAPWYSESIITPEGSIEVVDKPLIRSFSGKLVFPSYTKLAPKNIDEQNADIAALKGSYVNLQILSNKNLSASSIVLESERLGDSTTLKYDTSYIAMKVDGKKAYGSFKVSRSGSYSIKIKDVNGEFNTDPISYNITAMNDEFPSISLISPTTDVQVTEDALLPVRLSISDDYGFSGLKLFYRLVESGYTVPDKKFSSINIPLLTHDLSAEVPYIWDLNKIGIAPEDKYEYYFEVYDNDIVSGPKSSRTQTLAVKLPSLNEVLNQADESQKKIEKDLQNISKQAEDVKKDMEELHKEMLKNEGKKDMDWKEKKNIQDIQKKQADIQQKLSDVQKSMEQVTKQLQENNALSPETLAKFQELQRLLKEVNSPDLKKLQDEMQQMLEQIPKDQLQNAMQQAKFNEEAFRKSIERTIKILKRLQAEQKADALTKRAEELQKKQEDLQKKLDNTNPNDAQKRNELAEQQKNLKDDLKNIGDDIKDLEKLMKEVGSDMPLDEMNEAEKDLSQNETSEDMQDAEQNIQNSQFSKAQKSQKSASQRLKKFAEQMKKVKKEMNNRVTKEAIRKMQKAIADMLELSKRQEQLKQNTQTADYNSLQLPNYAKQQSELREGLANIANSLMELSQKSFSVTPEMGKEIGDALQQMSSAINQISSNQSQGAAHEQGKAMSDMNSAIMQMQSMLSQMQQGNGSCDNPGGQGQGQGSGQNKSGSFSQRLQQLANEQQAINQALQQMEGGSLTMEQQAKLGRIAQQQGNAQKSLDELAKEQKDYPGSQDKKTLGSLEKIEQEMKEAVTDLKNKNIDENTLKRQDRILSRLLDATKSIHERDFENVRESETSDIKQKPPSELDMKNQELRSRSMQDLLRSIQECYTKDYEALIRQYFESLQKKNTTPQ
jgi:hypothetical protein